MQNLYNNYCRLSINIEVGLLTLFITIFSYVIYWIVFPVNSLVDVPNSSVFLMSWVGISLIIYIWFSWYIVTGSFFSLYTIFMMFYFVFNFGQPLMWAFGIHIPSEIGQIPIARGFGVPTKADILNGQMITLISGLMFHLGAIICYKPSELKNKKLRSGNSTTINSVTLKAIFIASVIVGFVAIPITLYDTINSLKVALTSGYKALYYSSYAQNKSNFFPVISMFFFPSLVGLLIGSRYNKKVKYFVYLTFTVYLILNLLAGDRGSWVYKIIILVWLSHVCYKPLNFRKTVNYALLSFVGLYIVEAIVSLRNIGLSYVTVDIFINAFSFKNSPLILTIFEMGGTMGIVMTLLMYGWDIWPYANTYLLGLLGMVTNQVIYALDVPFSIISSWYSQEYLGISWGAGFSIVGEAVLNFGPYFAPLIMIVLGYIITSMIFIDKRINYSEKPLLYFFAVTTLHIFLPVTRGYFQLLLKNWFYGVILYSIFIILIKIFLLRPIKKSGNLREIDLYRRTQL